MPSEAYLSRGVSATKEDVHRAIAQQSAGVFPGAFCKLIADPMGDEAYCAAMHADGAGTKSTLAYLHYKETGDTSIFRGIAQDSTVMNIDDLLCVGAVDGFVLSNTIGRNAHRINGQIIKEVIDGYEAFISKMTPYGVGITMAGGETADVGDLVATMIVDSTVFVRIPRNKVVTCENIRPGDVIVGLASSGQAVYEDSYNSGISSNGLTAARHLILKKEYATRYSETFSNTIPEDKVFCGNYGMSDPLPDSKITVGQALTSPTRTYAPVIRDILTKHFDAVHGLIHCTGGGQVKCRGFGQGLHYIKDQLFDVPPIFQLIQREADITEAEMYQVFNMGHRMEIYCPAEDAQTMIDIAAHYHVDAQVVGHVEAAPANKVTIRTGTQSFVY